VALRAEALIAAYLVEIGDPGRAVAFWTPGAAARLREVVP
jgi:hypothetical protein